MTREEGSTQGPVPGGLLRDGGEIRPMTATRGVLERHFLGGCEVSKQEGFPSSTGNHGHLVWRLTSTLIYIILNSTSPLNRHENFPRPENDDEHSHPHLPSRRPGQREAANDSYSSFQEPRHLLANLFVETNWIILYRLRVFFFFRLQFMQQWEEKYI